MARAKQDAVIDISLLAANSLFRDEKRKESSKESANAAAAAVPASDADPEENAAKKQKIDV